MKMNINENENNEEIMIIMKNSKYDNNMNNKKWRRK